MPVPFIMPKVDMDQEKATIISWLKQEGDLVQRDETVLVVETEKVAIDIPAPASGRLVGICRKAGEVVPVAEVIAYILKEGETLADLPPSAQGARTGSQAPAAAASPTAPTQAPVAATPVALRMAQELGLDLSQVPASGERITRQDIERFLSQRAAPQAEQLPASPGKIAATPAARRLARERGLSLQSLTGSGPRGRIQAADVPAAPVTAAAAEGAAPAPPSRLPSAEQIAPSALERPAERLPLTGIRRTIAERMQSSFQTAPHIALTVEADVTQLEAVRQQLNARAARANEVKLSLTALLVKITAWALERHPYLNASLHQEEIYLWKEVNIGVATAVEQGLIVPVIRQANLLSLSQIAERLADLVERARQNRLTLADVQHGTFTISNLGMYGIQQFRAVINPPESAILAVGAVVRKPIVVDAQDTVAVRPVMALTLSADHRLVDGVVAARFLADLLEAVEHPETLLY